MANRTQSSFLKRQKELARQTRRKDKDAKKLEKKAAGEAAADTTTEDPDLAGIKLGPQPPLNDDDGDAREA